MPRTLPSAWLIGVLAAILAIPATADVSVEPGIDRPGGNLRMVELATGDPAPCRAACDGEPLCKAFTYVRLGVQGPKARCYLKGPIPAPAADACCTSGVKLTVEPGIDRTGGDYRRLVLETGQDAAACRAPCAADPRCRAYTFVRPGVQGPAPVCYLKARVVEPVRSDCCISGHKPEHVGLREHIGEPAGGVAPPPDAPPPAEGFGRLTRPLAALRAAIWTRRTIPVCWENPTAGDATERGWVRDQIRRTWERNSALTFTGWAACASGARGIRIRIADETPHAKALGARLDGVRDGVVLDFVDPGCPGTRDQCIRFIAVHEFGHALGFAHEQNRSDAPAWCRDMAQGSDGDIFMTPYDPDSVMNYCRADWANAGVLTAHDVAGLRFWYGPNQGSGMPWLPDCRTDALLFQHARFDGRRLLIRGSMEGLGVEAFNDRVSSLCVPAGFRLVVFEDAHFGGRRASFDGPINRLTLGDLRAGGRDGWNDAISSVRLIDLRTGTEVYDAPPECRTTPMLFQHSHFRGKRVAVGGDIARLGERGFNDAASSACVPPGRRLIVYQDAAFGGEALDIAGPAFRQRLSGLGWNDRASSARVR